MLRNADGGGDGGARLFRGKKRYEGIGVNSTAFGRKLTLF